VDQPRGRAGTALRRARTPAGGVLVPRDLPRGRGRRRHGLARPQ
jgi:hypothetical protein